MDSKQLVQLREQAMQENDVDILNPLNPQCSDWSVFLCKKNNNCQSVGTTQNLLESVDKSAL